MNERELSAVRAEIVAAGSCPRCGQPLGWPCREGGAFVDLHAERARAAGVDPAILRRAPTDPAPRRAGRPTRRRRTTRSAASTRVPALRRPAHEPKRATTSAPRRPGWRLEAEPGVKAGPLDVVFHPDRTADLTVEFTDEARDALLSYARARGGFTEEGGVLVGRIERLEHLVIADVSGPGPNSKRTATSYRPDGAHDQAFVDELTRHGLVEIGSWHLHPQPGCEAPSEADRQASARALMQTAATADQHRLAAGWLELIVSPDRLEGLDRLHVMGWLTTHAGQAAGHPWFRCQRARVELGS